MGQLLLFQNPLTNVCPSVYQQSEEPHNNLEEAISGTVQDNPWITCFSSWTFITSIIHCLCSLIPSPFAGAYRILQVCLGPPLTRGQFIGSPCTCPFGRQGLCETGLHVFDPDNGRYALKFPWIFAHYLRQAIVLIMKLHLPASSEGSLCLWHRSTCFQCVISFNPDKG